MRSTAAGGVRHDRPRPTSPHVVVVVVVVVVAVARGRACAGGRWRSPLSALRGLRHAPPPSLARAAPSCSTSLPPLSAVVRRSCAPDASSSAKKRRSLSPEADRARDEAAPDRARRYLLFAPIASLRMRSDDRGGADSPTRWKTRAGTRRLFGIGTLLLFSERLEEDNYLKSNE